MVRVSITRIGAHATVGYAMEELVRYLHKMDKRLAIDEFAAAHYDEITADGCETVAIGVAWKPTRKIPLSSPW